MRFLSYLKFYKNSRSKFSIHSPFVFDFIESVLEDRGSYYSFIPIEYMRSKLLNNDEVIKIVDLGAGSLRMKGNDRKISQIAKNSLQNRKTAQFLFRIINHYQCKSMIEVGTSLGVTTAYLASARKKGLVYTIEGCPSILQVAKRLNEKLGLKNIIYVNGNFDQKLAEVLDCNENIDFVYFDGNHTKEATNEYFNMCMSKINENTIFVFDDIYWSKDMQECWEDIKSDERVSLTIDLYKLGVVFFHSVKIKSHYQLKNGLIF